MFIFIYENTSVLSSESEMEHKGVKLLPLRADSWNNKEKSYTFPPLPVSATSLQTFE